MLLQLDGNSRRQQSTGPLNRAALLRKDKSSLSLSLAPPLLFSPILSSLLFFSFLSSLSLPLVSPPPPSLSPSYPPSLSLVYLSPSLSPSLSLPPSPSLSPSPSPLSVSPSLSLSLSLSR